MKWLSILLFWVPTLMVQAASLPEFFTLPPAVTVDFVEIENYGEAAIPLPKQEERILRGKRWHSHLVLTGTSDEAPGKEVWNKIKPTLQKSGWTVAHEFDSTPYHATLRYQKAGKDFWAHIQTGIASEIWLHILEVTAKGMKITLALPAAKPEKWHPVQDEIPYLTPPPGSERFAAHFEPEPMVVRLGDSDETQAVGNGVYFRSYHLATLSNVEFIETYREALVAAGWKILKAEQMFNRSDTQLIARYTRDGRDIWAQLVSGGGDVQIQVADAGANDLAAQLKRDCHVPLYGILFDSNKVGLKPESGAVLIRARDAIKANAALLIEVQGHTDNVGNEAYNQKLSESRAQSVMQWLTANGIPPARLSARGYGLKKPVADNDTDKGRALNRRVELACRK